MEDQLDYWGNQIILDVETIGLNVHKPEFKVLFNGYLINNKIIFIVKLIFYKKFVFFL